MGDGRWEMGEGGWGEGRWGLRYFPSSESLGFRLRSSDFGLLTSVFRLPSSLPADAVRQASSNFHLPAIYLLHYRFRYSITPLPKQIFASSSYTTPNCPAATPETGTDD